MSTIHPIPCEAEIPGSEPAPHTPRRLRSIQPRLRPYDAGSTWQTRATLMRRYNITPAQWAAIENYNGRPLKCICRAGCYGTAAPTLIYQPAQVARRLHIITQNTTQNHD